MSPSCCIPRHEEYARLPPAPTKGGERNGESRSRRLWRRMIYRVVRESNKCFYRCNNNNNNNKLRNNPHLTFQYDAVSYSQNFDEGCHTDDYQYFQRFSPVIIK
ncbi:putative formate dehydrogenase YrhE [Bienertia sinuspersici]